MTREARVNAAAAFQIPANIIPIPQTLNANGIPPSGSLTARGSSSRKEGTAKISVTPTAITSGSMRSVKSRSAHSL
jgi:hypothetical protein